MSGIYTFDDFEFDAGKLELTRAGHHTRANTLTLRLLGVLVESAGHIVTKQELLDRVWDGRRVSQNVVTVAMTRLRRALGYSQGAHDLVVNVHGRGYRFTRQVIRRDLEQAPSAAAPRPPQLLAAAFVGRDSILGHLRAALAEARNGSGSVVLLTGEPGIGKTRAAEVFGREVVGFGLPVAWGYCREVGDTPPLWPFAQLLRELIAQAALDMSEPHFASVVPELARLLPELAPGARCEPRSAPAANGGIHSKHRIFDAIARTLTLAAERVPCLLVLDDLHRADPASLELLSYLIDEIPRTRLLVIGALRSKFAPTPDTLARVLGHRNATRLALPRLSEVHVGSYLESILGSASPELCHAVFTHSEGNPFFMTELARQVRLVESGDPANIEVPEVALDVVRQRVAGLDEVARGALSCAAVIGRNFSLPVLQAVTGSDGATLMASLDAALAHEVVSIKRDSRTEFRFGHELLRAVLYDALSPAERRSCHLRVAEALEERAAQGDDVPPADLAYHSRSALPMGDPRKTISHCRNACIAAAHVFAYGDAARCLQHALEALDMLEKPSPRLRIQLLLHQALFTRAQSTRAFQPLIARVVQLAHEHNQPNTLARAAMLHDPYPGLPPLPGSVQAFQAALRLLEAEDGEPTLRAAMLARLAACPPAAFDAAQSGELLDRAEVVARTSPELLDRFSVRAGELYLRGGPANRERGRKLLHELFGICRENGVILSIPPVMLELYSAITAFQDGDANGAYAALERGVHRCRDLDSELLWHFERFLTVARFNTGGGKQAARVLKTLHERARKQAIAGTELFCAYDEALLFGVTSEQSPSFVRTLEPADNDRPNIWSLKLRALHASGHTAYARAALQLVPASRLAALPSDRDYLGTLGALARVAIDLRLLDYAEALYALLAPYPEQFAVHVSFVCEGSVSLLLGMLARVLGRREKANEHLRLAAEVSRRTGVAAGSEYARSELERDAV